MKGTFQKQTWWRLSIVVSIWNFLFNVTFPRDGLRRRNLADIVAEHTVLLSIFHVYLPLKTAPKLKQLNVVNTFQRSLLLLGLGLRLWHVLNECHVLHFWGTLRFLLLCTKLVSDPIHKHFTLPKAVYQVKVSCMSSLSIQMDNLRLTFPLTWIFPLFFVGISEVWSFKSL